VGRELNDKVDDGVVGKSSNLVSGGTGLPSQEGEKSETKRGKGIIGTFRYRKRSKEKI